MTFTRRQLRIWAARVLFLWLFGLGVGVAHACITASAAADAREGVAATQHEGCSEQRPTLKSNCSDFCEKAGSSIRSQYTGDDIQAQALQLPALAVVVTVPAFEPARSWAPRRDGAAAPPIPIPIAFLRLAL